MTCRYLNLYVLRIYVTVSDVSSKTFVCDKSTNLSECRRFFAIRLATEYCEKGSDIRHMLLAAGSNQTVCILKFTPSRFGDIREELLFGKWDTLIRPEDTVG